MYLRAADDFGSIQWDDPADADGVWWADRTHCPTPLPPLAIDVFTAWVAGGLGARMISVNGFVYMAPDAEPPATQFDLPAVAVWDRDFPTNVQGRWLRIRQADYAQPTAAARLRAFDEAVEEATQLFVFTMDIIGGLIPATVGFLQLCSQYLGREGPLEAMTILAGDPNATLESALGLERLAELAEAEPAVAAAIRSGDRPSLLHMGRFGPAFGDYLGRFGCRCANWFDFHEPTWAERPEVPLSIVARYLAHPAQRPSTSLARAAEARAVATGRMEAAISEPTELSKFRETIIELTGTIRVIEERALWQMQAFAALREPALSVGRGLVDAGLLDAAEDVFFFDRAELKHLVSPQAPVEPRLTVSDRRSELARWKGLLPPVSVGSPRATEDPPHEWGSAELSEVASLRAEGKRVIKGVGVSRGVATGIARVA
jgi:hypothetical protein